MAGQNAGTITTGTDNVKREEKKMLTKFTTLRNVAALAAVLAAGLMASDANAQQKTMSIGTGTSSRLA